MSAPLPRLLAGVHPDGSPIRLEEHLHRHGPLPWPRRGADLIALTEAGGLRGRGGAGFPTARKLAAVAEQRRRPVVVANGAEGEPASSKDKALMRCAPHLVLDGAALAAAALGAREAVVAVAENARHELAAIGTAIGERKRRKHDGGIALRLAAVPDAFVLGEETALLSYLAGGPGLPKFTPPRPFERGLDGAPTLVQNVETLAHLAVLARYGSDWFRRLGTAEEPGSTLVTLGGAVRSPGVYEVALGTPLRDLLAGAGGPTGPLSALLVGGYFGTWVEARTALSLRLLDEDLARAGASLGARAIVALPEGVCGVVETARVARYLANESAGQCGPCVFGLGAIAAALEGDRSRRRSDPRPQVTRWLGQVQGRGACRHPDGAARFVASALSVFEEEYNLHAHGRCTGHDQPLLPVSPRRSAREAAS